MMKKADSLTKTVTKQVRQVGQARAKAERGLAQGRKPPQARGSGAGSPDHVDAINQLFAELELAYHNQYHKAYAQDGSLEMAKKYWLERLSPFPPQIIIQAVRTVVTEHEYLPALATMVRACEEAGSQFGLPAPHEAYREACHAPEPKAGYAWSHPAVYLAGKKTGWFELATKAETSTWPLFEEHYRRLCRRVIQGESLTIRAPEALAGPALS